MAAPPAALPPIDETDAEELRLAVVMNGGVSLAVWIGGVASEINRLVRKQGVYGDVARATASTARVDVISGTSAGGINGALLALATVYDADLASLRNVWLYQGSLEQLLRGPTEDDPPSLLRGNDYFLVELRRAFAAIRESGRAAPRPPNEAPIDLTLTTTLLHGNANTIPDDFGTVINDVNHRARFTFRRGPDVEHDSFNDERIADRLAFAARATSSFPVAFEPLYYAADTADAAGVPLPRDTNNLGKNRFLLDGGILDNKPLESAIDAVFKQRADRDVRRVLAYVVPNPGTSASATPDKSEDMPSIAQVALASLMELPRVESISAQIEAVLRQNRLVRRKHQNRAGVLTLGPDPLEALSETLFGVYRRRRLQSSADYLLPEVSAGLLERGAPPLGRRLRDWFVARFLGLADQVPWVPTGDPFSSVGEIERAQWRWGVFALENIADTMLDLLRRSLQLTTPSNRDLKMRRELMGLRKVAFDHFYEVRQRRTGDAAFWRSRSAGLVPFLGVGAQALDGPSADRWLEDALRDWREKFAPDVPQRQRRLAEIAASMAKVVATAAGLFREHFVDAREWRRVEDVAALDALTQQFEVLAPPEARVDGVLRNLLVIEVVLNAFGSYRDVQDQYIETIQVSAEVPTSFGGPSTARQKLAGAQLANFGAFLKRSWRANDWMFGRLDGAERLSRVLLNPERLRRLYGTYAGHVRGNSASKALEIIHWLAVEGIASRQDRVYLERLWLNQQSKYEHELAFLDDDNLPIPEQLPHCAGALARRLHFEILRDELPVVAGAIAHDLQRGGNPRGQGADFGLAMSQAIDAARGKPLPPETIVTLFNRCRVGEERVTDEVGSDLVTSLAARAVAVTVAAGAGKHSNLGPVRKLFQLGRVPAIALDFFAQGLVRRSRTSVALFTAALTIGAAIVLFELIYEQSLPSLVLTTGSVLLVATMAFVFLRRWKFGAFVVLLGGALMVAALSTKWWPKLGLTGTPPTWLPDAAVLAFFALTAATAYWASRGDVRRR